MKAAFFGQFLLDKGVINTKQFADASDLQNKVNLKIGQLVLEKKLLTPLQVKIILDHQKRNDVYFGEAAQQLGFLTLEQVQMLLKEQEERHIFIGEALIRCGYITQEQLKEALVEFNAEQKENEMLSPKAYPERFEKEKIFIEQFVVYTIKLLSRMGGIIAKYDHYEEVKKSIAVLPVAVEMHFRGDMSNQLNRYLLMTSKETAQAIAVNFFEGSGMAIEGSVIIDALSELVNIICGQVCGRLWEFGKLSVTLSQKVMIDADQMQLSYVLKENQKAVYLSMVTSDGKKLGLLLVFFLSLDKNSV
ncbi:MAG: hypothetical protein HY810_03850 [Candidatus Omnitrophica bacterium]|nr:hypothetical protein [Candidatus Omnitrophota bacterium]